MAAPDLRVEGTNALKRKLAKMDPKQARKITRRAIRRGARPIRDDARRRAPARTSYPKRKEGKPLKKAIVIRSARKRRGHQEVSVKIVGPPHSHLVEMGTGIRIAKRGRYKGKKFGRMPAQPFLGPAYDHNKRKALDIAAAEMEKGILGTLK